MTDANDDNVRSEEADSGRSTNEKLSANVIAVSGPADDPDVYLVEYPDGSQVYEPATPTNQALFEDGLYEEVQGYSGGYTRPGETVDVFIDVEQKDYRIESDGMCVDVPDEMVPDLFDAVSDQLDADVVMDMYDEIVSGQVRRNVVSRFYDAFPSDRVECISDGWVVDDTFLVDYEANNYLVENESVYVREGGDMVEADESKQAVDLNFDVTEVREMRSPDGDTVEVSEAEQTFLATVECLLFPNDYLGAELVDDVEQARAYTQPNTLGDVAETASVSAFTDSKTGNYHRHGFDKHRAISEAAAGDLGDTLGMTEEAIDKLYFNDYDHAAPHELRARRDEFENAPFDIFEDDDVSNDDLQRWTAIQKAKESAPINDEHHRQIRQMFDDGQASLHQF